MSNEESKEEAQEKAKAHFEPTAFAHTTSNEKKNIDIDEDEVNWSLVYILMCMLIVLNVVVNIFLVFLFNIF